VVHQAVVPIPSKNHQQLTRRSSVFGRFVLAVFLSVVLQSLLVLLLLQALYQIAVPVIVLLVVWRLILYR